MRDMDHKQEQLSEDAPENRETAEAARWPVFRLVLAQYVEFAAAVRFLSVLPFPWPSQRFSTDTASPRLISGGGYFPLVGLLLGLLVAGLAFVLHPLLPPLVVAAVLVVALVMLTGGLHLDGLMDSCDGFFGGAAPERRLEIMRDSRVGSFGVLGGGCALLLKFALLASVSDAWLYRGVLLALPLSRWAMLLGLRLFPSARATGLGAAYRRSVTAGHLLLAGGMALAIALAAGFLLGVLLWGSATLLAITLGVWMTRRLGGLTGDTYGALSEVSEVILLLLWLILTAHLSAWG